MLDRTYVTRIVVLCALASVAAPAAAAPDELAGLRAEFARRTGAELVFTEDELGGDWYDRMPALGATRRVAAARILVAEAAKYPAGWLGAIGLRKVGVFAALVSEHGDGFRPYDADHDGYLYYGMWNGTDAVAASFYTDGQLPLTFHHEVFHHVDATVSGVTDHDLHFASDDARFVAAVAGRRPYPALQLDDADRTALARRAGEPLAGAVSDYAAKAAGEDQAETARWLMSHLAAGLWQAAAKPELAGSQRVLHVLAGYGVAGAGATRGPDAAWLIDVALGRDPVRGRARREFASEALRANRELLERIAPQGEPAFVVRGHEDGDGGNRTLRADLTRFGDVAERLAGRGRTAGTSAAAVAAAGDHLRGLLARYRGFIAARWSLSAGTRRVFDDTRRRIDAALPPALPPPGAGRNPYLDKVDAEITESRWRAAIRAVQPATVRLGGGSGVNLAPAGLVLTAGHVVDRVGATLDVRFPDGSSFRGTVTHVDTALDLALVALAGARDLPTAPVAAAAPEEGDDVAVIGQPGKHTPDGDPTGYQPWHVSSGHIRGFRTGDRTGEQSLGRTKHDAWTYWGHSGSPLFDRRGAVVALHNSWDSATAMRHAVTWEAIVRFLERRGIPHRPTGT